MNELLQTRSKPLGFANLGALTVLVVAATISAMLLKQPWDRLFTGRDDDPSKGVAFQGLTVTLSTDRAECSRDG